MDQTTLKPPLSQQVKECLDAGMSIEEGSQYVNIYQSGFGLIAHLIRIRLYHTDPQVRSRAQSFLDEIDLNGGIGTAFRAAYKFSVENQIKTKTHRSHKAKKGVRRLSSFELNRIKELSSRSDINEDESSEVKRIQASILDEKISSMDYEKIKQISAKYYPSKVSSNKGHKKGWTKMDEKTYNNVQLLLDRSDVSDANKKRTYQIMDNIQDGKIPTIDYLDITRILANNKFSKKEMAKRDTASKTFENAIFMACQACDNLDDMKMPVLPKANRVNLVAKISGAAVNLLRLQNQLLYEEEDDEGRDQGGVRSSQESLSDLAPVPASVPGSLGKEDRK